MGVAMAQTADNSMAIGLGVGATQIPEEGDFSSDGLPVSLFFDWDLDKDWLKFRFGINAMQKSKFEFDIYDKTMVNTLATNSAYVAYRYTLEITSGLEVFGIAGLAMMSSKLEVELGDSTSEGTASTACYMYGGGIFYFLGSIGLGAQIEAFSGEADFDGAKLATGSTQLQLAVNFGF